MSSAGQVIRFPEYREYESRRVEASNAMMALLAGAQLANHLLGLTEGSERLLPELFPRVAHIGRLNLSTEEASRILGSADTHLGAMSVPYALALHEDYLKSCLHLLARAGLCSAGVATHTKLAGQHAKIAELTQGLFDQPRIEQLNVLRLMRNCLIHQGRRADAALINAINRWSPDADQQWHRLAPSPAHLDVGDLVAFGHPELILTLAVTKALGREANILLQRAVPRQQWVAILIDDAIGSRRERLSIHDTRVRRKIRGIARFDYGQLNVTDEEITAGLKEAEKKRGSAS